jgi:hypothetical protein
LALGFALERYADEHDGWFPRGEATPEASLSLLYQYEPLLVVILGGKAIPPAVAEKTLESGGLLTPETCDWHYVEGLRSDDDPNLALFWDKSGLGHFGQRLSDGGHVVFFIGFKREYISRDRWDQFLAEQEQLRAKLRRPR